MEAHHLSEEDVKKGEGRSQVRTEIGFAEPR